MTISYVRGGSNTADGSSSTIACTISTSDAGNVIAVGVGYPDSGSSSVTGVADDNGNTYTAGTTETRNATQGYSEQIWYAYNINAKASTLTITATYNGSVTFRRITAAEYHSSVGAFSTDPKDSVTGTGTGNGTAIATGTITPTANNAVIIGYATHGSGTVSAGSGFTLRQPSGGGTDTALVDQIQTTATGVTAKATGSVSGQWGICAFVIKDVTSSGATVTPSAISTTTSFPSATKSGGATVGPAAISTTTSFPAATVSAGGATVTPAAISTTTSFPSASESAGATVTPAAITTTTSFAAAHVSVVNPPPVGTLIEFAYGADPDSDLSAAVWTDITSSVQAGSLVTIRAGRHGLGAQTDPLMIRFTLNNRDGQFTPFLNTGTNFPDIVRNLPVRVSAALDNDTPVELAVGFVDSFELGWDESANNCVVFVTASGRLSRLARKKVAVSATTATVASSSPVAYWPLTDGESATSAASGLTGGASMTKTGSLHFGTGNAGPGQPKILDLAYYTSTSGTLNGTVPAGTSETSWRVECKMTWPDGGAAQGVIGWRTQGTVQFWQIGYDESTKALRLQYWAADGSGSTTVDSATAPDPGDQLPHTYRVTADQSGANIAIVVYVDGVSQISTTATTHTCGHPTRAYVNPAANNGSQMPAVGGYTFWAPYSASVDTESAATGYPGESAADRISRLCDETGTPVTVVAGDTSLMGIQSAGTLLNLLRECEAADGGLLHDNGPDGSLVYIPRSAYYNALVDMTVDVDLRHLSPGFRPVYDGRDLVTSAIVTQPDGSAGSYSVTTPEGVEERSYTLNLDDSEDLEQHAAWRVAVGTVEGMRYPRVGLNFRRSTDLVTTWLTSGGVGMRVDVTNLPQQHPPLTVEQFAEGYEMRVSSHLWEVDVDCVPADPYEVMVLDTSTATLVSAVDSDDTTFTTVVSEPPRWTTTDEPVQLQCGGETPIVATTIADVAISYVAAGAASHADNAAVTPALYAGATAGDLICVLCAIRSSGTGTVGVSGYTRMVGWANFALFGKIHTGSESDPTVTPTGGSAGDTVSGFTFGLRNTVSNVANAVIDWADWLNDSAQNIAYPPLSTQRLWDGCAVLYLGWKQDDYTSVATIAGATEILEASTTTGSDQSLIADYVIQTTATAIATGSFTVTGGASAISRGMVVAIAPGRSTLTVTRATNGTAISHAAGDSVQVANTGNLGL